MNTKSLINISMFASLIAVGAFIKIPFFIVPITLQTLFVVLSGLFLKKDEAIMSVVLYLFVGLIGFPVFSRGGGLTYIFQPSFGYLIGFIFCVVIIEKYKDKYAFISSLIGIGFVYIIGCLYFIFIQYINLGKVYEIGWLFYNLFIIFLPGDIISCYVAYIAYKRIKNVI